MMFGEPDGVETEAFSIGNLRQRAGIKRFKRLLPGLGIAEVLPESEIHNTSSIKSISATR